MLPNSLSAQAALKIVVIEGEDAVNVIRQKTAVAPIVEVRDRNDQPVAGAVVRFAITRGRASFNGARALTITTNQAGRAVATGFTPSGTGALQISATATFQGQTAAVAIAQTNVLTAAVGGTAGTTAGSAAGTTAGAGAGAGGAAAGATGAAAGGAGGISATTAGIVAGAAVGGAVAAKKIASSSDEGIKYVGNYSGPLLFTFRNPSGVAVCNFTIDVVGTLEMHLTTASDGSVSGTVTLHEDSTLGQSTCMGAQAGGPTLDNIPVAGSTTSVTFQKQETFSSTGATLNVTFQGVLNGMEIPGTLNENWSQTAPNGGTTTSSKSFAIILRQQ